MTFLSSVLAEAWRLAGSVLLMALGFALFFLVLAVADLIASEDPGYARVRGRIMRWWRERNRWRLPKRDQMPEGWEYRPASQKPPPPVPDRPWRDG